MGAIVLQNVIWTVIVIWFCLLLIRSTCDIPCWSVPELSLGFWNQEFRNPIWQKVGVPLEKVGVPLQKSWSPTNLCIPYIFSILAGIDTIELFLDQLILTLKH